MDLLAIIRNILARQAEGQLTHDEAILNIQDAVWEYSSDEIDPPETQYPSSLDNAEGK